VREPRLEVAEIFRRYEEKFLSCWGHTLSSQQRKALWDLGVCRTAALGGHLEQCDSCGHERPAYDSCRNRHCPKCQSTSRDRWLAEQAQTLLPVPYCHVVFTVPGELAPLALQNQHLFYALLFRAVAQTLLEIAADRRRLGARIGFLAVLHTWSQNLLHHPHVHCLVPAGGIALDGSRWISCRSKFFLPVRVLGRLFRGKLLAFLGEASAAGKLRFYGSLTALADPDRFQAWLQPLRDKEWVVYAKPPFGGPEQVLKYLARYTHRVAISNGRLVSLADDRVSFCWRDSKDGNRIKVMTLEAVEFIRRFLLHILPSGFVKIRHFGFLANRNRAAALTLCRQHLKDVTPTRSAAVAFTEEQQQAMERRCPVCQKGTLRIVAWLSAEDLIFYRDTSMAACLMDSS
jgi:hypothetical protein